MHTNAYVCIHMSCRLYLVWGATCGVCLLNLQRMRNRISHCRIVVCQAYPVFKAYLLTHSALCLLADTLCLMPTCYHTLPYAYLLTHSALCLLADTLCLMPTCSHTLPYAYLLTHSALCLLVDTLPAMRRIPSLRPHSRMPFGSVCRLVVAKKIKEQCIVLI
jgi:hypothetical protein